MSRAWLIPELTLPPPPPTPVMILACSLLLTIWPVAGGSWQYFSVSSHSSDSFPTYKIFFLQNFSQLCWMRVQTMRLCWLLLTFHVGEQREVKSVRSSHFQQWDPAPDSQCSPDVSILLLVKYDSLPTKSPPVRLSGLVSTIKNYLQSTPLSSVMLYRRHLPRPSPLELVVDIK